MPGHGSLDMDGSFLWDLVTPDVIWGNLKCRMQHIFGRPRHFVYIFSSYLYPHSLKFLNDGKINATLANMVLQSTYGNVLYKTVKVQTSLTAVWRNCLKFLKDKRPHINWQMSL